MDLVFDRRGDGEPLVLLHPVASRWQIWMPVLDVLARRHEVFSLDMPGFGASPPMPPGRRADVPALTDAVAEWMARQGLARPHVAGNSTGGAVALELAARGAVRSVTAIAPIGFWSARERAYCQASLLRVRAVAQRLRPALGALTATAPGRAALAWNLYARPWRVPTSEFADATAAMIDSTSTPETIAAFTGYLAPASAADATPVTIAWGDRDRLLLPRQGRRAQRVLPRARHVVLPGVGHLAMWDDPDAVAALIVVGARAPATRGLATA